MQERWLSHFMCCLTIATTLIACAAPSAQGWSNGGYSSDPSNPDYGTHDWIADKALAIQVKDVTFLSSTYHSRYLLGTEAPDNPDYIGDSTNHHIYYYSGGAVQDDKCAVRASQMYTIALGYLTAGDYSNAAYNIGAMAHYIADVGVFGHTMGTATDWEPEVHHSDYENEIDSMIDSLASPSGISLGDEDARSAALGLARAITFGQGTINSNVWMDTNYDWADTVFLASAMSSLNSSVAAVAAAINHLMIEAAPSSPPVPEDASSWEWPIAVSAIITVALAYGVAMLWRRKAQGKPPP